MFFMYEFYVCLRLIRKNSTAVVNVCFGLLFIVIIFRLICLNFTTALNVCFVLLFIIFLG